MNRVLRIVVMVVLALAGVCLAQTEPLSSEKFGAHLRELTATPNRLAGTPPGEAAATYIEKQLAGLKGEFFGQRFSFPQQIVRECLLEVNGSAVAVLPLTANGLQPPAIPQPGLTGPIVVIGDAGLSEMTRVQLAGAIVVADLNAPSVIPHALAAGAKAIIFVDRITPDRRLAADKETFVSVNVPRFFVSRADAEASGLLEAGGKSARLVSAVHWERRTGRNLFLFIPGTDPIHRFEKAEMVILSAPYDTGGVVPGNAPEPERAANVAGLLEIARHLAEAPPKRNVLIAFFDNHANFCEGGRQFYAALRRSFESGMVDPLPVRLGWVRAEQEHLATLTEALDDPNLLSGSSPTFELMRQRLRSLTKSEYDGLQEKIGLRRIEIREAKRAGQELSALQSELDALLAKHKAWQALREAVRDRTNIPEEHRPLFATVLETLRASLSRRQAEVHDEEKFQGDSALLLARLKNLNPVLHVSLRFTAGGRRWFFLDEEKTASRVLEKLRNLGPAEKDGVVWFKQLTTAMASVQWSTTEESAFAATLGIPAVTCVTDQDAAPSTGMPGTILDGAQTANLFQQMTMALPFLTAAANLEDASVPNRIAAQSKLPMDEYQWLGDRADGHMVKVIGFGETVPTQPVAGAIVQIMERPGAAGTPVRRFVTYSDENGIFPFAPLLKVKGEAFDSARMEAALFDDDGVISAISTLLPGGGQASVGGGWTNAGWMSARSASGFFTVLALFSGERGILAGHDLPFAGEFKPAAFRFLNSLTNAAYPFMNFQYDPASGLGGYFLSPLLPPKIIYQDPSAPDQVALYLDVPADQSDSKWDPVVVDLATAMAPGMHAVNETRLEGLRRRNIVLNSLEELHYQAREQLAVAKAPADTIATATGSSGRAAALERRVYRPVKQTISDMVKAVTVLLILAIPFSLAVQGLVFPTPKIYTRLAAFGGIFMLCFLALYFTHPAFAFSSFPAVILLAFVLLVMSGAVIAIIASKFSHEIKQMQGLVISAHTLRRSLFGNVGAAVSLALSTMRRRPARTVLTVTTVVLLTFTIVSFVSFQSEKGVNQSVIGAAEHGASHILIRHATWQALTPTFAQDVQSTAGKDFQTAGRRWQAEEPTANLSDTLSIPVRAADGGLTEVNGVLGLNSLDLANVSNLRAVLPEDEKAMQSFSEGEGIFVSPALLEQLHLAPGDRVRVLGEDLVIAGAFDAQKLQDLKQIDGSPFLPISFRSTRMAMGQFESAGSASGATANSAEDELARMQPDALEPVNAQSVILVSDVLAKRLQLPLRAVVLYPAGEEKSAEGLDAVASRLAVLSDDAVFLQDAGERVWLRYGDRHGMSGFGDVLVPLLLGGFIVFSTMLGSIIDREKEIYTFSALGLAPRNIAMLFFIEAAIYGVIGGFGGYLLGQAAASLFEVLASLGLLDPPDVNYSSATAINTILLVIGVVLVSTIYPALQAAKKATADTSRRWNIPKPVNDVLKFTFPFTISSHQLPGVLVFLKEYLDNHSDRTIGHFAAGDVRLDQTGGENGLPTLSALVWLQPFDQGISQSFQIAAQNSDIEEVVDILVELKRRSGPPSAWNRSLTGFLEDMRKEFLLWRTLPDETVEHYLSLGRAANQSERQKPDPLG